MYLYKNQYDHVFESEKHLLMPDLVIIVVKKKLTSLTRNIIIIYYICIKNNQNTSVTKRKDLPITQHNLKHKNESIDTIFN